MRASIVIAACNEGEALTRTLASCFETTGLDYEVIVADDASTDGAVEAALQRFPMVRAVRHSTRQGPSPTKALGARQARGDVLVFLDAHTYPAGALARLVEGVERNDGEAVLTPAVAALDVGRWRNDLTQVGHGYGFDLERFECQWLDVEELRRGNGDALYESPGMIGCAFAISRDLYDRIWGFDAHMRSWGVEDLDLGLKAWLLGARVLHDPDAVVGHRFRAAFDNYEVPVEDVLVNQLRMARKHFTHGVWEAWLTRARETIEGQVDGHPEGVWARGWHLFEADRPSVERERAYLQAHRVRDEFWYAERFGLSWPRLEVAHARADMATSPAPAPRITASGSPPPPVATYGVDASVVITAAKAAQLAAATFPGDPTKHVRYVGRYLRNLHPAEVTNLHTAGLQIFSILQHCNNHPHFFDGTTGTSHAREAITQASGVAQPNGTPIYFAVDYDPYVSAPAQTGVCAAPAHPGASTAAVSAYFQAVNAEFTRQGSPYAVGVYGCGQLLTDLRTANLATFFWQSMSTAFTGNRNPWPGRNLRQLPQVGVTLAGVSVDLDEAPNGNPGAW